MSKRKAVIPAVAPWRFYAAVAVLVLLACALLWRALSLQILDTEYGREFLIGQGDARTLRTETIPAHRGMILDRHGEPLAVSTPVVSIWFEPEHLLQAESDWPALAKALGMSVRALGRKVRANQSRQFVYLRRHLAPDEAAQIMALDVPGVRAQREYRRFYPAGEVTAHIVGFTDIDDRGQEGLELAYDNWLSGRSGSKKVLKNLRGQVIRDVDAGQPAEPGKDLMLSIDLRLQYLAYRELKAALASSGAHSGSVVMLDRRNGEVLAMVNQPSFNPNDRRQMQPGDIRNRAITDVFEPGSTMKPLTLVAALESGQYQPQTVIDTNPGYLRVGKKTLMDHRNYGTIDVSTVLKKSSQVGTSKIALSLDEHNVWEVFHRFGLGQSTGSGFPGEANGTLPNYPRWKDIERVNFAFGYGLSVTSLQLARAYSAFANHGRIAPVSLLRRNVLPESKQVLAPETARKITAMLHSVTQEGGTGTRAQVTAYTAAGKTGTVHKVGENGYAEDRYIALFAGFAPAVEPEVVTVVVINEPGNDRYYGGEVAAPVFARINEGAMRLLNIAPDQRLAEQNREQKPAVSAARSSTKDNGPV